MATQPRFSRTTLPARAAASALLVILGSTSGAFPQIPAAPAPKPPVASPTSLPDQPPATAAPAPKTPAAADPAKAPPPVAVGPTEGALQIVDLLASFARYDQDGRPSSQKIGFELPERAVNEYLVHSLRNRPRPGISAATVTLLSGNSFQVAIEIDFDAVKQWAPDMLPEAMRAILTGKRVVKVSAHFESANGTITFALRDVTGPDGKPFAGKVITDLMQSIGVRQPESYDTTKPIPLPFGLKRVWTDRQSLQGET